MDLQASYIQYNHNTIISLNIDIHQKIEKLVNETLKKCKTNTEDKKQKNKKLPKTVKLML